MPTLSFSVGVDINIDVLYHYDMAQSRVKEQTQTQRLGSIITALTTVKRGNSETTDNSGLYTSSEQSGRIDHSRIARLNAYKESIAKSGTTSLASSCGAWAVISECESGQHHFAKRLYCGREWCDVCGKDNSASHKRRQARLLPKLQQVKELGYFVIEFPDLARHVGERGIAPDVDDGEYVKGWCYSKADLRDTTNTIVRVLAGKRGAGGRGSKRVNGYFARGIARWHWFGDKLTGKYNPHCNVLVDFASLLDNVRVELQPSVEEYRQSLAQSKHTKKIKRELQGIEMYQRGKSGYMPKPLLDRIKAELRQALNCPDLIVHYSKRDTPGKIMHCARYVTRATFKDYTWNEYMAQELWNFRNIRWWGNWNAQPVWDLRKAQAEGVDVEGLQAVSNLQLGVCPDCGKPLRVLKHNHNTAGPVRWSKPIDSTYLLIWSAKEIAGTGYYRIPYQARSGTIFTPGEILRLQTLETKARRGPSVGEFARAMRRSVDDLWRSTRTYKAMYRHMLGDADREDTELLGRVNGDGLAIQPKAEAGGEVQGGELC